jgi:hypothetical protein
MIGNKMTIVKKKPIVKDMFWRCGGNKIVDY